MVYKDYNMDRKFKEKVATAEKTEAQGTKVHLFNLLVQSQNTIPVEAEQAVEADRYTLEDERKSWLFEQLRMKAITRSICLDMAGILALENKDRENDKYLTQLSHALFYCQTYKSNMRCDTRFCLSCSKKRSAEHIDNYLPVVETWEHPQFVTLTVPSVPVSELQETIDKMFREFSLMIAVLNKKYRRKGIKYLGLRMFECEVNAEEQTYSPLFHLIVENRIAAKQIISQWKKRFGASDKGQDIQPIIEGTSANVIAYATKFFADKQINVSSSTDESPVIYLAAYLNIFKAMGEHKQFCRFGRNIPKELRQKKTWSKQSEKRERLIFDVETTTLLDYDTGKKVLGFNRVPYHLQGLLSNTNTDLS